VNPTLKTHKFRDKIFYNYGDNECFLGICFYWCNMYRVYVEVACSSAQICICHPRAHLLTLTFNCDNTSSDNLITEMKIIQITKILLIYLFLNKAAYLGSCNKNTLHRSVSLLVCHFIYSSVFLFYIYASSDII